MNIEPYEGTWIVIWGFGFEGDEEDEEERRGERNRNTDILSRESVNLGRTD